MEFLLIGESKLKIVVSKAEMEEYQLDGGIESGSSAGLRRAFWKMLDRAKDEVGFDPKGDKVLIQFYPLSSGGCEIFVTKLGILPEASARLVARSKKIEVLSRSESLYAFDSEQDLRTLCGIIKSLTGGKSPPSDVYFSDGKYFLSILEHGKGGETSEFLSILEFGSALTEDFSLYIREHARRLTNGDGVDFFSAP